MADRDTAALVETALGVLDTAEDTLRQDGFLTTLFIDDGRAAVRALAQRLADAERRNRVHVGEAVGEVERLGIAYSDAREAIVQLEARATRAEEALRETTDSLVAADLTVGRLLDALRVIGSDYCTHATCNSREHRKARAALTPTEEPEP